MQCKLGFDKLIIVVCSYNRGYSLVGRVLFSRQSNGFVYIETLKSGATDNHVSCDSEVDHSVTIEDKSVLIEGELSDRKTKNFSPDL